MFCSKCGNQMPDGAKFCSACGAEFATAEEAGSEETANSTETTEE